MQYKNTETNSTQAVNYGVPYVKKSHGVKSLVECGYMNISVNVYYISTDVFYYTSIHVCISMDIYYISTDI